MRAVSLLLKYFSIKAFAGLLLAGALSLLPFKTASAQSTVVFLDGGGEVKAPQPPMRAAKSKLAFQVRIPRAPIIEALNRFDTYREVGQVTDCPRLLDFQVCNYSYDVTFERDRDGVTDLEFNDKKVIARVPIKMTGDVAYRATTEAATRHKLEGKFTLVLTTKVSIEKNWCVEIDSGAKVLWHTRPKLVDSAVVNAIVANLQPIDVQVERNISAVLTKERLAAIKDALCQTTREQIQRFWRPHVFQFSAKNLGEMYAHIVPSSIKYSGPAYSGSELSLGVHLDVTTSVGFEKKVIDIGELPPLMPASSIREQILLDVPAFMSLHDIKSAAMQIVSANRFNIPLPIGGLEAELHNVEPDVSTDEKGNPKLAFKVDYSVGFSWLPLRAWGVAWISGRPVVDSQNSRIVYNQVEAKLELTNALVAYFFSWALPRAEQALRLKIVDIGKSNVKKELDTSTEELRRQVAQLDTVTGFRLELKEFHPVLDSLLAIESSGLVLYARASGQFEARMREISPAIWDSLQEYFGPFKRPYEVVNVKLEKPVLRQRVGNRINKQSGRTIDWPTQKLRLSECEWLANDARYMWCKAQLQGPKGEQLTGWIRQYHLAPSL